VSPICNCNTPKTPSSSTKFVVSTATGEKEFADEPEARIYATMNNGRITVKKK